MIVYLYLLLALLFGLSQISFEVFISSMVFIHFSISIIMYTDFYRKQTNFFAFLIEEAKLSIKIQDELIKINEFLKPKGLEVDYEEN